MPNKKKKHKDKNANSSRRANPRFLSRVSGMIVGTAGKRNSEKGKTGALAAAI